jgi:hypothetical protein
MRGHGLLWGTEPDEKKVNIFIIVYLYFCLLVNPNSATSLAKNCKAPATPSEQVFV